MHTLLKRVLHTPTKSGSACLHGHTLTCPFGQVHRVVYHYSASSITVHSCHGSTGSNNAHLRHHVQRLPQAITCQAQAQEQPIRAASGHKVQALAPAENLPIHGETAHQHRRCFRPRPAAGTAAALPEAA